jgi:signal transduction histidine kinase
VSSTTLRSAGLGELEASDTEPMLRTATWIVRVVGLVAVGVSTFTGSQGSDAHLAIEVAAFVVASATMGLWAVTDHSGAARERFARLLPLALAAMTVACGAASVVNGGGPLIFLGFIAMVSTGGDASLMAGWVIVGLGVLGVESASVAYGSSTWTAFGYPLILLVGLLIGHNRRAYRVQAEQSAALLAKVEQLQEEQSRVATLDERNRIAREIHDVLAHSLGALGVQIQAARAVLTDQRDIERTAELLDQAQRLATDGLSETRRAVHALRADTPPLPEGLADLGAAHQLRHRATVALQVNGQPRTLTPDAGLALTRTAQEALVNTAKHAPHQPVEVRLDYENGHTTLAVTNELGDGATASPFESVNGGYGLAGMRERLLLIEGTLSAGPRDGKWTVTARVPQ